MDFSLALGSNVLTRYAQNTPDQVKNMFWGSKIIPEHSNKNLIYKKA